MTKEEFIKKCKDQVLDGEFLPCVLATNGRRNVLSVIDPSAPDPKTRQSMHALVGRAIVETFKREVPTLIVSAFEAWVSDRTDCAPCDDPNHRNALIFSILQYDGEFSQRAEFYEVTPSRDLVFRKAIKVDPKGSTSFEDRNMRALAQGMISALSGLEAAR